MNFTIRETSPSLGSPKSEGAITKAAADAYRNANGKEKLALFGKFGVRFACPVPDIASIKDEASFVAVMTAYAADVVRFATAKPDKDGRVDGANPEFFRKGNGESAVSALQSIAKSAVDSLVLNCQNGGGAREKAYAKAEANNLLTPAALTARNAVKVKAGAKPAAAADLSGLD